jgi:nitrogen fixation protein FixH
MEQKKSKIPYFFIAFFAVVFAVDFSYIYISQKTWRGISTEDSYHKGLNYNQTILAVKNQKDLGWKMNVKYRNDGNKNGVVIIDLLDKNSVKIRDVKVVINFKRPTQEGFDFSKELKLVNNQYQAQIIFPLKGQWDFEIVVSKADVVFGEVKRYVVQ